VSRVGYRAEDERTWRLPTRLAAHGRPGTPLDPRPTPLPSGYYRVSVAAAHAHAHAHANATNTHTHTHTHTPRSWCKTRSHTHMHKYTRTHTHTRLTTRNVCRRHDRGEEGSIAGAPHQPAKDSAASRMRLSGARLLGRSDLDAQDSMQGALERWVLDPQSMYGLAAGTLPHNHGILAVFRQDSIHVCIAQRRGGEEEGRGGRETLRRAAETPRTAAGSECSLARTPTPQQAV